MDERPVDAARYRKVLAKLVPAMLTACERAASARAQAPISAAAERAGTVLNAEIERLGALARVNPGVRPEEIAAAQLERAGLLEAIAAARPPGGLAAFYVARSAEAARQPPETPWDGVDDFSKK